MAKIRDFNTIEQAIKHALKDLNDEDGVSTSEIKMVELSKQSMGLLVFKNPDKCGIARYENMVSNNSWEILIESFRKAWCVITRIPNEPKLACALRIGLTVMKTAVCKPNAFVNAGSKRKRGGSSGSGHTSSAKPSNDSNITNESTVTASSNSRDSNNNSHITSNAYINHFSPTAMESHHNHDSCPVCDEHLGSFATNLPRAHKSQSMLICRVSGHVMNESNPPMAFPNGQIYSSNAIKKMSVNGAVKCPNTGFTCTVDALRRVFIL